MNLMHASDFILEHRSYNIICNIYSI